MVQPGITKERSVNDEFRTAEGVAAINEDNTCEIHFRIKNSRFKRVML